MTIGSAVNDDESSIGGGSNYSTPSYSRDLYRNEDYSPRSTGDSRRPPRYPSSASPMGRGERERSNSPSPGGGGGSGTGGSKGGGKGRRSSNGGDSSGGRGGGSGHKGGRNGRGKSNKDPPPTVTVSRNFVMNRAFERHFQEIAKVRADRRKLTEENEALRAENARLRGRVSYSPPPPPPVQESGG